MPPGTPKNQTAVFHLFDLFQPDDLTGKVGPDDVGWKRAEWRATEMAQWTPPPKSKEGTNQPPAIQPVGLAFRAVNDLDEPKVDKGQLTGKITGPEPVLDFSLKENRGGADSVKFIEVRMNVSGAKQVWLRPERAASVDDDALIEWAAQTEKWNTTADVVDNRSRLTGSNFDPIATVPPRRRWRRQPSSRWSWSGWARSGYGSGSARRSRVFRMEGAAIALHVPVVVVRPKVVRDPAVLLKAPRAAVICDTSHWFSRLQVRKIRDRVGAVRE